MPRLRRVLGLAIPTGLLAALAMALPAQAASVAGTAACEVQGTATTSGVGVNANTGTYSFTPTVASTTLNLTCVVSTPPPQAGGAANGGVDFEPLNVSSSGSFNNSVCGTGTADSTDAQNPVPTVGSVPIAPPTANNSGLWATGGQWPLPVPVGGEKVGLGYHIDFAGGQGALRFTSHAGGTSPPFATNPPSPGTYGGGPISISATPGEASPAPPATPTTCTVHFTVAGALAGAVVGP
jgi:hypothetical protein